MQLEIGVHFLNVLWAIDTARSLEKKVTKSVICDYDTVNVCVRDCSLESWFVAQMLLFKGSMAG